MYGLMVRVWGSWQRWLFHTGCSCYEPALQSQRCPNLAPSCGVREKRVKQGKEGELEKMGVRRKEFV